MITPLPLNRGYLRVCSLYYFIMYQVRYPGTVFDQTTGDEGTGIVYRTFDTLSSAQQFIADHIHQFPEFTELCSITVISTDDPLPS